MTSLTNIGKQLYCTFCILAYGEKNDPQGQPPSYGPGQPH